jgi:hypothetical protein
MSDRSATLPLLSESRGKPWLAPHRIALMVIWLVTTATIVVMLLNDVRSTDQYKAVRYVLLVSYVAALLWYLGRTGPSVDQLPELGPQVLPRWRYGAWVPVLGVALVLALAVLSDAGVPILDLLMMAATGLILLAWRREIRLRSVVQGLGVALIAYLAGLQMANNGYLSHTFLYLLPAFSFPMYMAGGLLFKRTRLGRIQLLAGQYGQALKSVLWGGLLFVPLGLINAAGGAPGSGITWVTKWWMPLWLPWFSGLAEETWFRLFLVGLCFFFLRPAFRTHPALAVVAAVLFSGITFGLGHGQTLERFLITGLLYGVPFAAMFVRRDWEHAVGAHSMVNMIPWAMAFLET